MKFGIVLACIALLISTHIGRTALAEPSVAVSAAEPAESSLLGRTQERLGSWLSCVIIGTMRYVSYVSDKSNWVKLRSFSEYLETGDCFYRNYEWAAEIYREGAKAGKQAQALYLGHLYLKGLGVERNLEEARRWFDLGVLYEIDTDLIYQVRHIAFVMGHRRIPPELMEAIRRGRKKLDGDGLDILKVAIRLSRGTHGMTQNKEAGEWLSNIALKAKNFPPPSADGFAGRRVRRFAEMLKTESEKPAGEQSQFRIRHAFTQIYDQATLGDFGPAQKIIAEAYEAGDIVPKDLFIAYLFYRCAQNNGFEVSKEVERVRSKLTPEEISEVESDIPKKRWVLDYRYREIRQKKFPPFPY